jgi:hypothetical protein
MKSPKPKARAKPGAGETTRAQFKGSLRGSSVVLLEPDVAKAFPDAGAVNAALRLLIDVARSARLAGRRPAHEPRGR